MVVLVLVTALSASGLVLVWAYHPPPEDPSPWQLVHRWASVLLLPATWSLVAAAVGVWSTRMRSPRLWIGAGLLAVIALAAAFTGYLLPWEQATVPAAVVPPEFEGIGLAFERLVTVVQVGEVEITRSTYQRFALAHLVAGALVVAAPLLVLRRQRRGDERA